MTRPHIASAPGPDSTDLSTSNSSGNTNDQSARPSARASQPDADKKASVYPAPLTQESILAPGMLAALLAVSKRFIKRLEEDGLQPVTMAGRSPRYRYGDVLKAMRVKSEKRQGK